VTARPTALPREQFLVAERYWFLNHAGMAPIPRVCNDAVARVTDDVYAFGGVAFGPWEQHAETVRASAARLMGVGVDEVAFVKNTTEGLGIVASGLTWHDGDRVLVASHEFPSTVYPWLALRDRGIRVDLLEPVGDGGTLLLDVFDTALASAPTRVVCVSWAQFGRGWRTDLAGWPHSVTTTARSCAPTSSRASACCNASSMPGASISPPPTPTSGCSDRSARACSRSPAATSTCSRRSSRDGPRSRTREEWDSLELVYDDTARRFEGDSTNLAALAGMGASIDLLLEAGIEEVWAHVDALGDRLATGLDDLGVHVLTDRSGAGNSGIVTFAVPGHDTGELWERLDQRGFICSPRVGGIRIAPHGYNTVDEIDELVAEVAQLTAR